jgi:hypothetical protein
MLKKIIWMGLFIGLVFAAPIFDDTKPAIFIMPSVNSVNSNTEIVPLIVQIKYVNETLVPLKGISIQLYSDKGRLQPISVETDVNGKASASISFSLNDTGVVSITAQSEYPLWQPVTIFLSSPSSPSPAFIAAPSIDVQPLLLIPETVSAPEISLPSDNSSGTGLPTNSPSPIPFITPTLSIQSSIAPVQSGQLVPSLNSRSEKIGIAANSTENDSSLETSLQINGLKSELGMARLEIDALKKDSQVLGVSVGSVTIVLLAGFIILFLGFGALLRKTT